MDHGLYKHKSPNSYIFFNSVFIPCFSGSKFFRVQIFQGPGFSESRFFRVSVQGPSSGFRSSRCGEHTVVKVEIKSKTSVSKNKWLALLHTAAIFLRWLKSAKISHQRKRKEKAVPRKRNFGLVCISHWFFQS